jgi:hypothetical protein
MTISLSPFLNDSASFDIDLDNGFLPAQEPLSRLGGELEVQWEEMLDRAVQMPLMFAGGSDTVSALSKQRARLWRRDIRMVSWMLPLKLECVHLD